MKRYIALKIIVGLTIFSVIFNSIYWGFNCVGPLTVLSTLEIQKKYKQQKKNEVVFYGASNFRLWKTMEEDLEPYAVQNHGFGGSTDELLMKYADKLLYLYEPSVVFFQTGSNDYAHGSTVEEVKKNKDKMYTRFREKLPNTTFVVMSGLPLPGRPQYWEQIQEVNTYLEEYCNTHENMYFASADDILMTKDKEFRPELFRKDQIHLNEEGQKVWSGLVLEYLEKVDAPKKIDNTTN